MARGYSVIGPSNSQAAPATLITIIASTTARPAVFDIIVGSSVTPADQASLFIAARFTAAGTTTPYTPNALDSAAVASVTTAGVTATVEPTYTANKTLVNIPLNQRASWRWVASPGYELIAPATASNGVGLCQTSSTATFVTQGSVFFFE